MSPFKSQTVLLFISLLSDDRGFWIDHNIKVFKFHVSALSTHSSAFAFDCKIMVSRRHVSRDKNDLPYISVGVPCQHENSMWTFIWPIVTIQGGVSLLGWHVSSGEKLSLMKVLITAVFKCPTYMFTQERYEIGFGIAKHRIVIHHHAK